MQSDKEWDKLREYTTCTLCLNGSAVSVQNMLVSLHKNVAQCLQNEYVFRKLNCGIEVPYFIL